MDQNVLVPVALMVFGVLVVAGLFVLGVYGVRSERRRYVRTRGLAATYGLYPPGRVAIDALPWLRHLPDNGEGNIKKMFVGRRGGRPVAVAEYSYLKPTAGPSASGGTTIALVYVATVRLPAPLPPRQGRSRYGTWFTAGTDLAVYGDGMLVFPTILGALDELLAIGAQLTT